MKVLICGAGRITRQLLKRMGQAWEVVLLDKREDRLTDLAREFSIVTRVMAEDASSPVVLEEAGLPGMDYVLALTDKDKVNLAVCEFAREHGVDYVMALVGDPDLEPEFRELGARTVSVSTVPARTIAHYLKDPRVRVSTVGTDQAEIIEVDVPKHFHMVGRRVADFADENWRIVGLHRDKELLFAGPDTVVLEGDRLVILARPDQFLSICGALECGLPHFPLSHGRGLLLALVPGKQNDQSAIVAESMHLARNTQVRDATVLCGEGACQVGDELAEWAQVMDLHRETTDAGIKARMPELCRERDIGVAVMHPLDTNLLTSLGKPTFTAMARSLPCPLLVARHTEPYERILVPFNAMPMAEQALETAMDLAGQLRATVTAVLVEEPGFLHTEQDPDPEQVFARARELARIHKVELEEELRQGNPVKEIVELSSDYNLMVLGSANTESGLFSPNVGELLAKRAACSVLILTG